MRIRPYPARVLLALVVIVPAWRLSQHVRQEFTFNGSRVTRWAVLGRLTPEELGHGVEHRYHELAPELRRTRDVGYFSEKDRSSLWAEAFTPGGAKRIERYYMAQGVLAPALLRFDETHPLVVIDCATPEQADVIRAREGLSVVHDYGQGLLLARPGF